jgi:hypothetical protein
MNPVNPAGANACPTDSLPAFDKEVVWNQIQIVHQLASESGRSGKIIVCSYGEDPTTGEKTKIVFHAAIGDAQTSYFAAMSLEVDPHSNVYVPLSILRSDIPDGRRGTADEIEAVLGAVLDADNDKGEFVTPPLEADYIIQSSSQNLQYFYFFDRALTPEEAKPLLAALVAAGGGDTTAKDIAKVFRVAGCRNAPSPTKIKRGRLATPQLVTVVKPWNGSRTSVDRLKEILAPHLTAESSKTKPRSGTARKAGSGKAPTITRELNRYDLKQCLQLFKDCRAYSDRDPKDEMWQAAYLKDHPNANRDDLRPQSLDGYKTWEMFAFAAGYEHGTAGRALIDAASYDPQEMDGGKYGTFCNDPKGNAVTLDSVTNWAWKRGIGRIVGQSLEKMFDLNNSKTSAELAAEILSKLPPEVLASAPGPSLCIIDEPQPTITIGDFVAYLPSHQYLFIPVREMWPAAGVDAKLPPMPLFDSDGKPVLDEKTGKQKHISPSKWLDWYHHVDQATWAPGEPMEIADRLISEGGWFVQPGATTFNLYKPPEVVGMSGDVSPWLSHIRRMFGDETDHVVKYLAHRVQRPNEKINHALVFGGAQGIGKDTILEPVKRAVGPWNFKEVSPQQMLGRFNGFAKSVILRVSELRDLGDVDRYAFYEHTKTWTAAPPDTIRVDEKNLREHYVLNVTGVIITSNHKTGGLYLPADDRRHFVAWSSLTKEDFTSEYWTGLYKWFGDGGTEHVAHYLQTLDISDFDPKAPPPKTTAWWEIVNASRAPEDGEMSDALEKLTWPAAVTVEQVASAASGTSALGSGSVRTVHRFPIGSSRPGTCGLRTPPRTMAAGRFVMAGRL